jgi:hypothetical protein
MTPEERAAAITARLDEWTYDSYDGDEEYAGREVNDDKLEALIAEAIRSAVADRTEACARIAYGDPERFDWPYYGDVRDIAAAIRALDAADERPDVDAAPPAQDARQDGSFPAGRGGVEKGGE